MAYNLLNPNAMPRVKGQPINATPTLAPNWMDLARTTTDRNQWFDLKRQAYAANQYHTGGGQQALYSNPLAGQFDTETSSGHSGLLGRIGNAVHSITGRDDRIAMAKIAAFVGLASALGAASAGGGGGGYAGETAAGAGGHSAGAFGAAAGSGGAASASGMGGPLGALAPVAGGGGGVGFGSLAGSGLGGAAAGGGGMNGMWTELLKTGIGSVLGGVLNKQQVPGKDLSRAPFESGDLQRYLPPELRAGNTGPLIGAGISGIGDLLMHPGALSPNVAESINPRLAAESANIAQNYRGIASNQAGAAARGNLPVSIKGALQSALDVAQERAQRGARNEALQQSETMRRADLERVFQILDAILQFQQAGRGTATAGLGTGTALESQKNAAMMALIGNLLNSGATSRAA